MSESRSRLEALYAEANRRRVFRVIVVYLIVGLAALEGTSNLTDALGFPSSTNTLVAVLLLVGLPIVVVVGWHYDLTGKGFVRTEALPAAGTAKDAIAPATQLDPKSIAVLPFVDMSPNGDQEYLGDGIAEEIINTLTRIEDLRVVARTSSFLFRNEQQEAREIGARLNVGSLVEGSVQKIGDQVRVTAQLIDVAGGFHLWSERFDRPADDVFAIQDEVAHAIVDTLKVQLGDKEEEQLVKPGTDDLEAYTLYLRGRQHWNRRTAPELEKGIDLFKQAIAIDDRYALAWSGLADSYSILGWYRHIPPLDAYTQTVAAASSAVAVDDTLAEPYTSLAYARFLYGWDWDGAEEGFQAAIERNPQYEVARHFYAEFLIAMGRMEEATEQMDLAHSLDPLSPTIGFGVGWVQYFLGNYQAAIEKYEATLAQDPDVILAPWFLAPAYVQLGEYERAIEVCEAWMPRVRRKSWLSALLGYALAKGGDIEEAQRIATRLKRSTSGDGVEPDHMALVYIGLGDNDRAFDCLRKAVDKRIWYLVYLNADPVFGPLREDQRFERLVRKVGLPARA